MRPKLASACLLTWLCVAVTAAQDTRATSFKSSGYATAVEEGASVAINGEDIDVGSVISFGIEYVGEEATSQSPVVSVGRIGQPAEKRRAILIFPDIHCTLVLNAVDVRLRVERSEGGGGASPWRIVFDVGAANEHGTLDIYRNDDTPPLFLRLIDGPLAAGGEPGTQPAARQSLAAVLVRGSGRVARESAGTFRVSVATGEFRLMDSRGDRRLAATGPNSVVVSSAGFGAESQDAGIAQKLAATRGSIVGRALLRPFTAVAEETAEGELEPPTGGKQTTTTTPLVAARVSDLVPRGAGFTSLAQAASSARPVSVAAVGSTAVSFLTQNQSAALAVVGARLQSTRLAIAGAGSAGALTVNQNLSRRFTIGVR